jgi:hypothetical protein
MADNGTAQIAKDRRTFDAAVPILSQLFEAEMAEQDARRQQQLYGLYIAQSGFGGWV